MINRENLKGLLKALSFEEKGNIFSKYFPETDAYLKVDFKKNLLVYPVDKGFKVHGDFTCNFTSDENFVVFECVHRLFEKGYKPEHIELEPKWKVGHGASGGRADILVKDNTNKSFLIIECKTEGNEFKKEWNNTLQRGGQLLSYAKQAGSTQFVCLYTSNFDNGKLFRPFYYLISIKDNEKLLEELADKKPLSFKEAKALEVEDIYKAWKETYNRDFTTKGLFEEEIQAYHIGKEKYTFTDLNEIGSKDIQSKYHEFATIMRQHNVSGRENAFDKLVNLFLCKIVDENKNPKDLKFYWKGVAYDTFFDLQDRLQLLYQAGMKEFLGEDVTYIDNTAIDKAFRFFKKDPDATKETIKKYFRQLKFFTNNDFAFIDVHNEKLFYQNSAVLLKIVQMLQDIKLQSETQNQFLGDMFEGFLDQGVKQSEGQFFTPMPIVKFILSSLPLEEIVKGSELPPKAIDYACGAGHFLNELALQIKPFVTQYKQSDIKEYYKEIIGIEKEYRLSKVAKVSAFMYGQDDIKITYADALSKNANLEEDAYSILVANPPYAVKGFLQTLSEGDRKAFSLINTIDEKSLATNNSIETFFIERAKQLLKPGGVTGIILPSSILSNDSSIYIATREIIIKYFDIVAITEFGSQTFGKTGTNTVALFMRRKEENPAPADHWQNRVNSWFGDNETDAVYKDSNFIKNYCFHIGIDESAYKTLLAGNPTDELLKTELFVEYHKAFENQAEIKNLKKATSIFSKRPKGEQLVELRKRFIEYLQEIEKEKLFFYVMASEGNQKVVVIKSPIDSKEQKKFLGYEWSSAKGNEGIKYINQEILKEEVEDAETKEMVSKIKGLHNINTPLYNPDKLSDIGKLNHYIQQNFLGRELLIEEGLSSYIAYHNLVDMIAFNRTSFNKQIQLSIKSGQIIQSKWSIHPLGSIALIKKGQSITEKNSIKGKIKVVAGGMDFAYYHNKGNRPPFTITISASGANAGFVNFWEEEIFASDCTTINANTEEEAIYLFNYLKINQAVIMELARGAAQPHVYPDDIKGIKVPYPEKDVIHKIVKDIIAVDEEIKKSKNEKVKNQNELENIFKLKSFSLKKLNEVIAKQSDQIDPSQKTGDIFFIGLENIESNTGRLIGNPLTQYSTIKSNKNVFQTGDILYGKLRPNLNKVYLAKENGICSTDILVFRCADPELNRFYAHYLRTKKFNDEVLKTISGQQLPRTKWTSIETIKVPSPTSKEKQIIINQLEKLEKQINDIQLKIDSANERKKQIMKRYL